MGVYIPIGAEVRPYRRPVGSDVHRNRAEAVERAKAGGGEANGADGGATEPAS